MKLRRPQIFRSVRPIQLALTINQSRGFNSSRGRANEDNLRGMIKICIKAMCTGGRRKAKTIRINKQYLVETAAV